jgi:hypothetical protein
MSGGITMVSMKNPENRRDPRTNAHQAISFSQLNKAENYVGITQDFSRSGMFFHSSRKLKSGACIVILPLDCHSRDHAWGDGACQKVASAICASTENSSTACRNFVNMVTAKVTRCEALGTTGLLPYGVAVDYIRPTI